MKRSGEAGAPGRVVEDVIAAPRSIGFDAPWEWLAAGWRDLWTIPTQSLTYGALFALAAAAIAVGLASMNVHALFLALVGGFLLLGPLAAVGLYEASRRLEAGQPVTLGDMLSAGSHAFTQLLFFGGMLMFAYLVWMRIAMMLLALFLGSTALPPPDQFMQTLLFTPQGLGLLVTGTIVGGLIALVVFASSAVAIPLLLSRRTDAISATVASIAAVVKNPKPMLLWAALIAVMMGAGFAVLLAGLVVAFPLVGHASWHAYRALYGVPTQAAAHDDPRT